MLQANYKILLYIYIYVCVCVCVCEQQKVSVWGSKTMVVKKAF